MTTPWDVFGVILAAISVILILVGIAVTWDTFWQQRYNSDMGQIRATLAILEAARHGMESWGVPHFGGDGYDEKRAIERASSDYKAIVKGGGNFQNFKVPTEPVAALLEQPSELISVETISAA